MLVVQCWDDGVTADARLIEILRRHGAKATFNLNPGLHGPTRGHGWTYRGTEVLRFARDELAAVYDGFTIANHSLTHPHLDQIPPDTARREIADARDALQQHFAQPVDGFAYPFGRYNDTVMDLVRAAGHTYARTTVIAHQPFPPADPMALHPSCHFLDPDFWTRFEQARLAHHTFYFWGHSYELTTEPMWSAFDAQIERITHTPDATWSDITTALNPPPASLRH